MQTVFELVHETQVQKLSTNHHNVQTGEPISNHDELMCNFFAQPDALAYGKVWFFYIQVYDVCLPTEISCLMFKWI
jgi:hypothetical protein